MEKYYMRYELKDKAKEALSGNYGILILGRFLFSLLIFLVIFIFGFVYFLSAAASLYSGGGYGTAPLYILQAGLLIVQILCGFLSFGTAFLCLKSACGQPGSYTDIFYGFRAENLSKVFFLTTARVVSCFLCLLPGDYLWTAFQQSADTSLFTASFLAYGAGYAVYIPISLALDMSYFLLSDFPGRRGSEILRDSFRLIKGNRRRLFALQLSFLPLMLLSLLSLGVGSLWLDPYMHMTYTLFYLDLVNPKRHNLNSPPPYPWC